MIHGGDGVFGKNIYRNQWIVRELTARACYAPILISNLRWSSFHWERLSLEGLLEFLVIQVSPADSCWFSWGLALPDWSCYHCCYPDSTDLDCWCIHKVFVTFDVISLLRIIWEWDVSALDSFSILLKKNLTSLPPGEVAYHGKVATWETLPISSSDKALSRKGHTMRKSWLIALPRQGKQLFKNLLYKGVSDDYSWARRVMTDAPMF